MSERKKDINDLAGCQRALCQGNCAPNHYWDTKTNSQDQAALFEQMEREVKTYGIDSWKWYCHTDPGRSRQRLQARRREADLSVLRAVEKAGPEDLQRPQGLRLAVADAGPPGQSGGRRKGRPRSSRT